MNQLIPIKADRTLALVGSGERASYRFLECFTALASDARCFFDV